jgi:hypothetical protein
MGEPGADSAIIVVEKDWPCKRQRRFLHRDLGLVADCKSFRTKEALTFREWVTRLLRTRRGGLGSERNEFLTAKSCTRKPPTTLCSLGEYNPGATSLRRVS